MGQRQNKYCLEPLIRLDSIGRRVKRRGENIHASLLGFIREKYGADGPKEIAKAAKYLGCSEGTIKKWIYRARRTPYDKRVRIAKLTNGRVGIDDW